MAMTRDEVVDGVAQRTWHQVAEQSKAPGSAQVPCDPEARGRAYQHAFHAAARTIDPHHRVHAGKLGMACADFTSHVALERGEAKPVLPLVSKDELHAGGAQATRTVIEQKRRYTQGTRRTRFIA